MSKYVSSSSDIAVADVQAPKIGIITALPKEFTAVRILLKKSKKINFSTRHAGNSYILGEIPSRDHGTHLVALALMVDIGNNLASSRATQLLEHFPSIDAVIMVGIAGGVPHPNKPDEHVRLGDIVISNQKGVVQYDFINETITEIQHRYPPRPPSAYLLEKVNFLAASEIEGRRPWLSKIEYAIKKLKSHRPPPKMDVLASSENPEIIIQHPYDPKRISDQPRVFIGPIASANILLKNPFKRDQLRDKFGVKAIEMEGSGIADATWNLDVGYLVIRGICDYCDSKKGDEWQQYAAIVAACYCHILIASLPNQGNLINPNSSEISQRNSGNNVVNISVEQKPKKLINRRYRLEEEIGQGSFGVVYKAFDTRINLTVAIKKIKVTDTKKGDEKERAIRHFMKEANALANLTHQNIVKILGVGRIGKSPFLVMPYLPGGTLESHLKAPISYVVASQLLAPIARALTHAHNEGFIHRDITPRNIMFTASGDPILTDFGLVKSLKDRGLTISMDEAFAGTFLYAAPEHMDGHTNYQSDIYSLGIIFYQLVTSHIPFIENLARRFSVPYPEKPSSYIPGLPEAVDQVILCATARDQQNRYSRIEFMAEDLEKLASGNLHNQPFNFANYFDEHQIKKVVEEKLQKNERLLSLVEKFEQEFKQLIVQKDMPGAKRLLRIIGRFGLEGQQAARRLQDQIKD